jgi:D-aspartate ligase
VFVVPAPAAEPCDPSTVAAPSASQLPVLVLGKHMTGIGVLRAVARLGLEAYVVEDTTDVITRSRLYRPPSRKLAETDDSAALAAYLDALEIDEAVVIGCSDRWAAAVAGLPAETRARFRTSAPPRESVDTFLDKDRLRDLVAPLGIPHPRTVALRSPSDLDALSDADLSSGFLKPTDSQLHNRVFGTKGFFVDSRAAAEARVRAADVAGITYILQEWIPGGMRNTILFDGFVDRSGSIRGITARQRVRMNPPRLGNTTAAVTIPYADVEPAMARLRTLLEAAAFRGIFNCEFKLDDRDGDFKLIELNPRPAWMTSTLRSAGADLVWMAYLDAQELEVPKQRVYRVGRYGVCETPDTISIVRAWTERRRPDPPVLKPWLRGDHILFRWSDPMPFLADLWRAGAGRLRSIRGRGPT